MVRVCDWLKITQLAFKEDRGLESGDPNIWVHRSLPYQWIYFLHAEPKVIFLFLLQSSHLWNGWEMFAAAEKRKWAAESSVPKAKWPLMSFNLQQEIDFQVGVFTRLNGSGASQGEQIKRSSLIRFSTILPTLKAHRKSTKKGTLIFSYLPSLQIFIFAISPKVASHLSPPFRDYSNWGSRDSHSYF